MYTYTSTKRVPVTVHNLQGLFRAPVTKTWDRRLILHDYRTDQYVSKIVLTRFHLESVNFKDYPVVQTLGDETGEEGPRETGDW